MLKDNGLTPHSGPKKKKRPAKYDNSFSSEGENEEDEALAMALKMSKQQAEQEKLMSAMNTTDGFKMALEMSAKEGDLSSLKQQFTIKDESEDEECSDEDMRIALQMSKQEEQHRIQRKETLKNKEKMFLESGLRQSVSNLSHQKHIEKSEEDMMRHVMEMSKEENKMQ
jgi:hypothetical protein